MYQKRECHFHDLPIQILKNHKLFNSGSKGIPVFWKRFNKWENQLTLFKLSYWFTIVNFLNYWFSLVATKWLFLWTPVNMTSKTYSKTVFYGKEFSNFQTSAVRLKKIKSRIWFLQICVTENINSAAFILRNKAIKNGSENHKQTWIQGAQQASLAWLRSSIDNLHIKENSNFSCI